MHCVLCIVYCVLCIVHCVLCIVYCVLYIVQVANLETAKDLASCAPPEGKTWSLFLKVINISRILSPKIYLSAKVDCGNKRAGVRSDDAEAVNIVAFIHKHPRQV